ncbi:hypothetical protein CYMTET_51128 [Cymbomonas tetramitiformis]|uniref:Uncharacterized protein n=1 Tax=Cymbomonas tetramitiformis TaxID=36881 RepID=A0AAE0BMW7_9CHLO|nr:hypothetical protein CYMTET_51128 [Cymbomonas tetramitiformis]
MFILSCILALIPLVTEFWAGVRDTFDFDDISECSSLTCSLRSLHSGSSQFFPQPHPNALMHTTFPQAFREMGVTTRAKKSLTRDIDIDASLRLIDGVRNSPTVRTPTVPTPNPASNEDADVAIRRYLQE